MGWQLVETIANLKSMNIDLESFFRIIGKTIEVDNKTKELKDRIFYEAAYPDFIISETDKPEQVNDNIICYSVSDRSPAPIGSSKKQLRPIPAAKYKNTDTNEIYTLLLSRHMDRIRFDAFAPSSTEAEHLMIEFERFMELHFDLLEYIGLERIVYVGRGLTMTTMKSGYHNRSALYDIVTEEHYWRKDMAIDEIIIGYGLSDYSTRQFEYPEF